MYGVANNYDFVSGKCLSTVFKGSGGSNSRESVSIGVIAPERTKWEQVIHPGRSQFAISSEANIAEFGS